MAEPKRGERPGYTVAADRRRRADAAANRARILEAAAEAFDRDGLDVSLDEIARRAGVGPGTVHRHFPTKAALVDATLADRVRALADEVAALAQGDEPTQALVDALMLVTERGAASHALADRLRPGAGDVDAAVAGPVAELRQSLGRLLRRAQRDGGVRRDLDADQLDALLAAAHTLQVHPSGGPRLVARLWDVLLPPT